MTIFCVFPYKSIITRSPFCLQIFLSLRAQYACVSVISRNDKTGKYRQNNLILTTMECQNYKIVPASSIKISYINTSKIHLAYQAVLLSGPVRLPYNLQFYYKISLPRKVLCA